MKKVFLTLLALTTLSPITFAQPSSVSSLRQSVVDTLVDYGTKLYERRDFPQAQAVFNRVLTYEANQPEALKYLNRMNAPIIKPVKQQAVVSKPAAIEPFKAPVVNVGELTIEELRARINQKKIEVEKLRQQLNAGNSASVSPDSEENTSLNNLHQDVKELRQQVNAKREHINQIKAQLNQK